MPIYEYKCECELTQEKIHKWTEKPKVICQCGKTMTRVPSSGSFRFNCYMPTPGHDNVIVNAKD
jgi:putative FmdB family regulatory protein